MIYKITHKEVEQFLQNSASPNYPSENQVHKQLSPRETRKLLADQTVLQELFPENVFLVGAEWLPMKKTPENMMYAAAQSHAYGSLDKTTSQCLGMSLCFSTKSPYGSTHHYMFYGSQLNVLLNHLYLHTCHIAKITNPGEGVALSVQFPVDPLEENKQKVIDFLSPYLGQPRKSDTFIQQRALAVSKPISSPRN